MGQLVLGVAGAAVGSFFGMPGLGWAIGAGLGASFGPSQKSQGPRLSDLRVMGTEYGQPIPYVQAHPRVAPQIIWASDRREISTTTSEGGKGGPSVESTSFTYEVDLLLLVSDNEIAAVPRVWDNGKLVFNQLSDASAETLEASGQTDLWRRMTVYTGEATQLPDPTYEAAVGTANAPAYRGRGTIFIEGLQLGSSGQMRNLTFEVATSADEGGIFATGSSPGAVAWREVAWCEALDMYVAVGNAADGVMTTTDGVNWTPGVAASNSDWSGVVEGEWLGLPRVVAVSQTAGGPVMHSVDGFTWVAASDVPANGQWTSVAWNGSIFVATGYGAGGFVMTSVDGDNWTVQTPSIAESWRQGLAWGAGLFVAVNEFGHIMTSPDGVTWTTRTSPVSAVWESVTYGNALFVAVASAGLGRIITSPDGITWTQRTAPSSNDLRAVAWNGRMFAAIGSATAVTVSLDGITWSLASTAIAGNLWLGIASNGHSFAGVAFTGSGNRVMSGHYVITISDETLEDVVSRLCLRAGLEAGQFDVTALSTITKPVRALAVSQISSTRAVLEQLAAAYFFECVLSDKLYFKPRGGASGVTIPWANLGASPGPDGDTERLILRENGELEIPAEIAVSYWNVDQDYNVDTQISDRLLTAQGSTSTVQMPLAFTASEAKGIADAMVADQAASRWNTKISLLMHYAAREPTDIVTAIGEDGSSFRLRLVKRRDSAFVLSFDAVLDDASVLTSAGITSSDYIPSTVVNAAADTVLELMDIPLLRDEDDGAGFYAAAKGVTSPWPGAALMKGLDGITYERILTFNESAVIGACTTTLGNWTGGNVFDQANTVTVSIGAGTLASDTHENVLDAGANACLIGSEVLQFKVATLDSAGVYTLSGLLRGRRGTEWAQTGHAAGERFVLLRPAGLRRAQLSTSELDAERHYKGVTLGRALSTAQDETFISTGVSQKPWSPVDLRVVRQVSSAGSLLLHFNDTNGATTFTDSSVNALTMTRVGGAVISTAQSKFGGSSGLFDGTGDAVKTPHNDVLDAPTGDFTIKFWLRLVGTANQVLMTKGTGSGFYPYSVQLISSKLVFAGYTPAHASAYSITGAATLSTGVWYWVEATRDGNTFRIYLDGVQDGSASFSGSLKSTSADPMAVGGFEDGTFSANGYIDDFCFKKGICDHPGGTTFTPPSAQLPDPGADDGSITLTWGRRTRLDTNFTNGTVPLGEASEAYEVDIFTSSGYSTVIRTITAASATCQYTRAQQVSDFGATQSTIYARVYQMSELVGRGYALERAI